MAVSPRFPTAADGYDRAAVDAFVVRLVERARSEIGALRAEIDELESALCAVAVAQWEPETFVDAPSQEISGTWSVDGGVEHSVEPEQVEDLPGGDALDAEDPFDDPVARRRNEMAAAVESRIRSRRLSFVAREAG